MTGTRPWRWQGALDVLAPARRRRQRAIAALAIVAALLAPWPQRSAGAYEVDLDQIFVCYGDDEATVALCAEARQTILSTCQTCHLFLRIARARFDAGGWEGLIDRHRVRVAGMVTDEQIDHLQQYLTRTFRPGLPPPVFPPELELMN